MSGYAAYKRNKILTQSREQLVVLLYEGAIRFLRQAAEAMQAGDHEAKANFINRAQAIIDELDASLDLEVGGEIAANLQGLYAFMTRHLTQAVVRNDPQMIREVIACLEDLNEGWKAVAT